jgi:hypothetical protein
MGIRRVYSLSRKTAGSHTRPADIDALHQRIDALGGRKRAEWDVNVTQLVRRKPVAANAAAAPSAPGASQLVRVQLTSERPETMFYIHEDQVVESGKHLDLIVQGVYDARKVIKVQGLEYTLGADCIVRLGKHGDAGLLVDLEYSPCSALAQGVPLLDELMATLTPDDCEATTALPSSHVLLWSQYHLADTDFSLAHVALLMRHELLPS